MQITFTEHARFEMNRRRISEELVKSVIENPEQRYIARKGRVVLQSKYKNSIEQKEMLLRVIGKEVNEVFIVITAYKTSKIEKILEGGDGEMKIIYDPETDTLNLILKEKTIAESDELREGIIVDYDHEGKIVSIEILDASEHVAEPKSILYELKETKVAV